jgi:phage recombination protein Bet
MSKELQSLNQSMIMWDDQKKLEEIRKLFAPTLTEMEFQFFVGLGKASGLNPFTREIWAVKYDKNAPAQVFIGRDGYRKAAQAHSEYDYHQSDAVYENDKFEVVNGEVRHAYTMKDRGALVGAYCVAKRHKSSRPIYVFAELKEYSTGRSVWKDKPATMIKKVAESQCLRACFQDLLGGTYGEEEINHNEAQEPAKPVSKSQQLMDKLKTAKGQTIEGEVTHEETGEIATSEQLTEIEFLVAVKDFSPSRFLDALKHYGVEKLPEITKAQAEDFIGILNKLADKE